MGLPLRKAHCPTATSHRDQPWSHSGPCGPDAMPTEGMAVMSYQVRAVRWERGWELHIAGIGVTQSHSLAGAERMIRDYLTIDGHEDAATAGVHITPQLDGLELDVDTARHKLAAAAAEQQAAAAQWRQIAQTLRTRGLSVADTATVLGVSKGRVSQLIH